MDSMKVGPIRYDVVERPGLKGDNGEAIHGAVDHGTCVIELSLDTPERRRFVTRWHEGLHIVLTQAGMRKYSHNEALLTVLSFGIAQILQDNPEMRGDA